MSITTLDGALAGMNAQPGLSFGFHKMQIAAEIAEAGGIWHNLCYTPGLPGASVMPAVGLVGEALTTRSGQLPFLNPVSGNTYLTQFVLLQNTTAGNSCILIDRLWHNRLTPGSGTTTTTLQSIVGMSTLPARDALGTTNGYMCMVAVEVYSTTGNNAAITTMSITYTDSDGNAGNSGFITSFPATAQKGTVVPFTLAAGDKGVRSIEAWTLGTSLSIGNVGLVVYRQLALRAAPSASIASTANLISLGNIRLYDNTVPEVWVVPATTPAQTNYFGHIGYAQG